MNCTTDAVAIFRYPAWMVASWLSDALDHARMSQAELARQLEERLRRRFDRAAVNKMLATEGKPRSVHADEMLAIASITGYPLPGQVVTEVPLVSWVSAGRMADASTQVPLRDVPLLAFTDLGAGDYIALRVTGTSMDRLSPEGSVILVNRADKLLQAGKAYVFSVRGEATYKRWRPEPYARLEPFSTDPAHEAIFVEDEEELEVVGRVKRTVLDL